MAATSAARPARARVTRAARSPATRIAASTLRGAPRPAQRRARRALWAPSAAPVIATGRSERRPVSRIRPAWVRASHRADPRGALLHDAQRLERHLAGLNLLQKSRALAHAPVAVRHPEPP